MKNFRASDGLTLAYRDYGAGDPILCLAGISRNSRDFCHLVEPFSDYRLVMPDYRGRGASDWDTNVSGYTPLVEARDAFELLDHLKLPSVKVIGTSRGGIVAMLMALQKRERISGILFNDVGPKIESAGLKRILTYLGRNPGFRTMTEAAQNLASNSPDFKNVSINQWKREAENRYQMVGKQVVISYDPGLRDAFVAAMDAMDAMDTDLWPHFAALEKMPLALIRGENSDLLTKETAKAMQEIHPKLAITTARDRGHCPFLNENESLTAIRRFLAS